MKRFFILLLLAFLASSCVSISSYRQTKARMLVLEYERSAQMVADTTFGAVVDTLQNTNIDIDE